MYKNKSRGHDIACRIVLAVSLASIVLMQAVFINKAFANSKSVVLATTNWKPYYHKDLERQGVLTDIIRQSLLVSGYSLKVTFTSWARAYKGAVTGKYMGILGAYYTEKRALLFDYSDPIMAAEEMLFTLSSRTDIQHKTLEDLKGYTIGHMISASHGPAFDQADYFTKIPAVDYKRSINRLLSGGVDLFVGGYFPVTSVINEYYPEHKTQIVPLPPAIATEKLYLVIRKSPSSLGNIEAFNQGLAHLKRSGKYLDILKHHGFDKQKDR